MADKVRWAAIVATRTVTPQDRDLIFNQLFFEEEFYFMMKAVREIKGVRARGLYPKGPGRESRFPGFAHFFLSEWQQLCLSVTVTVLLS